MLTHSAVEQTHGVLLQPNQNRYVFSSQWFDVM